MTELKCAFEDESKMVDWFQENRIDAQVSAFVKEIQAFVSDQQAHSQARKAQQLNAAEVKVLQRQGNQGSWTTVDNNIENV